MCGVMGDAELFNQFAAVQVTAQALAGLPKYPSANWADISALVTARCSPPSPACPPPPARSMCRCCRTSPAATRPLFAQGLAFGGSFPSMWGALGGDGTITGILNKSVLDTNAYTYTIDGDVAGSTALNASGAEAHRQWPMPTACAATACAGSR